MMFNPVVALERIQPAATLRFSITNARHHTNRKEYAEAIINYLAVLKSTNPGHRVQYLGEFLAALESFLKWENSPAKIHEVLNLGSTIFSTEFGFWRVWAEHLFSQGEMMQSLELFERSLTFAKSDMEWLHASTNIVNVKSNLIDSWHWRMINDGKRNVKYAEAISAAIRQNPGAKILDIGCGSGILSVLAARDGNLVYACECDRVMCDIACKTFKCNQAEVLLERCHSSEMLLAQCCDILVTETLDSAIFGEHIVSTVLDAKEKFLNSDTHVIIPQKAVAIFSLVESADILREHSFDCDDLHALISDSCYCPTVPQRQRVLPQQPYTCAYLEELPSGYRLLSEPVDGLVVDFENTAQLRAFDQNKLFTEVVIQANQAGLACAVAVWFRLTLFEEIEIKTAPEDGYGWQQAIFPFYPPRAVDPGEKLHFEVFVLDNGLHVQPTGPQVTSTRELLRGPHLTNFAAMHDPAIRAFFLDSLRTGKYLAALDCTDLLIAGSVQKSLKYCKVKVASKKAAIRYVNGLKATTLDKAMCLPGSAILFWPISARCLLLDDQLASVVECHIRSPHAVLIPATILLKGCLIAAPDLLPRSRLVDAGDRSETHCGVDLSPMDDYRLEYFHDLDPRSLAFHRLSDPVTLMHISFRDAKDDLGQLTKVKHASRLEAVESGECHALLYWFELSDGKSNRLSLLDTDSHNASAFIFSKPRALEFGDGIPVLTSLHHGNILFHFPEDSLI